MIKLLIFDLDGTLADTITDITHAVNYAVKPFGVGPFTIESIKSMVGSGISKLLESLISTHPSIPPLSRGGNRGVKEGVVEVSSTEEAVKRFLDYYSAHIVDNTKIYPHVKETLSQLRDYKKAVVSNKREGLSKKVLEGLEILNFFDVVFGSDSVPERKPSPVPVFELMKRFGASRDETVIIGDSNFDIEAGKSAGVRTVAVTYGYRNREVLKEADYMIDSFDALLDILPRLNLS